MQKKAATARQGALRQLQNSRDDDEDGIESTFLRGEASVANELRDGELTLGRLRHTLATAADVQVCAALMRPRLPVLWTEPLPAPSSAH